MSNLELMSVAGIEEQDMAVTAQRLHELVLDPRNRQQLLKLNLPSVVDRHDASHDYYRSNLWAVRNKVLQNVMKAYVIIGENTTGRGIVGMATALPDLPLYRQRLPLAAKLTRNRVLSEQLHVPGANVAAWIDHKVGDDERQVDEYASVFADLQKRVGVAWTLSPLTATPYHADALSAAGYQIADGHDRWERLDDLEESWTVPPLSLLFTAGVEIA